MVRHKYVTDDNGVIRAHVKVPKFLWDVAVTYSAENGAPSSLWALELMLAELSLQLEKAGADDLLSITFTPLLRKLRGEAQLTKLNEPDGIDDSVLHTSNRTKSGYVGVYANGNGFRAVATVPGLPGQKVICTRQTSREAAWERYLFYKKYKIPYGRLAEIMDNMMKSSSYKTEPLGKVRHHAIWMAAHDSGLSIPGLSPEDRALEKVHIAAENVRYEGNDIIIEDRSAPDDWKTRSPAEAVLAREVRKPDRRQVTQRQADKTTQVLADTMPAPLPLEIVGQCQTREDSDVVKFVPAEETKLEKAERLFQELLKEPDVEAVSARVAELTKVK